KAEQLVDKALDLEPNNAFVLAIDGMVRSRSSVCHTLAMERFQHAIDIEPCNPLPHLLRSRLYAFSGEGARAVESVERAISLSPLDPHRYFYDGLAAAAHLANNDFAKSLELAERSVEANPRHTSSLRAKAVAETMLGRGHEASLTMARLRRLEPELTVERYLRSHPARDLPMCKAWADALREAGLPQN
ncbi:MAG: hypothetical protein AAFU66_03835, partial [Pseudomonadota bacterium]